MENRYLHLMLSGSFAAEESLTLKINWLDPDFFVEDGMVVSDGSPHGTLTIPPFPSKTQVFVVVKIEITKLTLFDNFHLSIVSLTMVIWYFWNDIVCFWVLYTFHETQQACRINFLVFLKCLTKSKLLMIKSLFHNIFQSEYWYRCCKYACNYVTR